MLLALAALAAAQATTPAPILADRAPEERPALLILGTPHLANNNRDIANVPIEDVTTPERQREIAALVAALARFRPTRIAVEWPASDQKGLDERYAAYRAGTLTLTANERDQVALRLAARLGLDHVEAVDWNEMPPGDIADFDFARWAEAHGQHDRVETLRRRSQARADATAARMRCTPIADWYRMLNTPEARAQSNRAYFDYALVGDGTTDPGAVWVGNWYARNLRIFGHLVRLAKPGDRLLVLYGAGHAFLLDQYARQSRAFAIVDTLDYLPPAAPRPVCP